jgi:hypothetical protein
MIPNDNDVAGFVDAVPSPTRRRDAQTLLALYERVTGEPPRMWGSSIIGFGSYHYEYESGTSGDIGAASFSPRRAASTVYLADGVGTYASELERLGEHSTGAGCLYLKNLDGVDLDVLESIVAQSYRRVTSGAFDLKSSGG